ncbi:MAG: hypothetical protein DI546_05925 [Rhizobium sp.]|nr:MAG: hypothetical protein DI546_05925 [Rhizobium sp.]
MRIIPFPSQLKKTEAKAQDWSQQEIADFYRAHRLLAENGVMIGIDRGVSDIGEPWMVFFDTASQDVFMHVARIDGVCHLICDTLGLKLSAANIEALIAGFENSVRGHLSIRAERNSKVVLHPAARIIMSISAVFLLFKLGNSETHAKALSEKSPLPQTDGGAVRPTEKSTASIARAQSAFARAFETVDAPASAAIVASIILAGELSVLHSETAHDTSSSQKLPSVDLDPINDVKLNLQSEGERKVVVSTTQEQHAAQQKADVPIEVKTKDDSLAKDVTFTQQVFAIKSVPQEAPLAVKFDFGQKITINEALKAQAASPRAQEQAAELSSNSTDAKQAMDEFLKKTDASRTAAIDQKTSTKTDTKTTTELGNVTATSVPTLDNKVGFFMKTNLDLAKMYALMEHFAKAMGQYDFDYASGQVLIEEKNIANLSVHDVGIWTNVLGDGSTLSVIGHASLIDDVLTFFS